MREPWVQDWEHVYPDGTVKIFKGHPAHCHVTEEHPIHMLRYKFRIRDGSLMRGSYLCDGSPQPDYPLRYIDRPFDDTRSIETGTDQPRDAIGPDV